MAGLSFVALSQPLARGAKQALGGRPLLAAENMLRIHCLQLWWNLSDAAMEELHERPLYRRFVGLDGAERLPNESTVPRFRHLLEKHQLAPQGLVTINAGLAHQGLLLKTGTVVDVTTLPRPARPRTAAVSVTPRCTRPRRATMALRDRGAHWRGRRRGPGCHAVEVGSTYQEGKKGGELVDNEA